MGFGGSLLCVVEFVQPPGSSAVTATAERKIRKTELLLPGFRGLHWDGI